MFIFANSIKLSRNMARVADLAFGSESEKSMLDSNRPGAGLNNLNTALSDENYRVISDRAALALS